MRAFLRLMAVLVCCFSIASFALAESPAPLGKPSGMPASSSSAAVGTPPASSAGQTTAKAAPSATSTGVVGGAPTSDVMDAGTFRVRMRRLEQRIDELKLRIRRSHTRLSLLSETILSSGTGGAKAEVVFSNQMSQAFRLTQALFVLDGAVQYNKQDDAGGLGEKGPIPIFTGSIPPGDHTLQILVKFRGHGFGVFSYLEGYTFQLRETHSFTITEGKSLRLEVLAFEKGDATTPIEQRPAIRYEQSIDNAPFERSQRGGPESESLAFPVGAGEK